MLSIFDLFRVGIGPSSSHTVGPMRAARQFVEELTARGDLGRAARVEVHLFGSLAATGRGHATDTAILGGLAGETPEAVDPDQLAERVAAFRRARQVPLSGRHAIPFDEATDLVFHARVLDFHPNGMRFIACQADGSRLHEAEYYSVGGGFIVSPSSSAGSLADAVGRRDVPHPFGSGGELLAMCAARNLAIHQLVRDNERIWRSDAEIDERLQSLWQAMRACVQRGCQIEGTLPGGLRVRRRAALLRQKLEVESRCQPDATQPMDWLDLWAMAVNEENAAGGRVVTAPTNGAAGIIPAVLHYYDKYCAPGDRAGVARFLLAAGAVGILFKKNASISGAEVGCQGEVGAACSMAAAGLVEALHGSPQQAENAAEIGMEHHLGLTCDPVGGLVQIPCIERNAMAAVQAVNAARLAMHGDGRHYVSLDKVIKTMRETGADMQQKYKETALGGLAVNVTEC